MNARVECVVAGMRALVLALEVKGAADKEDGSKRKRGLSEPAVDRRLYAEEVKDAQRRSRQSSWLDVIAERK